MLSDVTGLAMGHGVISGSVTYLGMDGHTGLSGLATLTVANGKPTGLSTYIYDDHHVESQDGSYIFDDRQYFRASGSTYNWPSDAITVMNNVAVSQIFSVDHGSIVFPDVPAVPEPETYALLLGGLGLLGIVARKRALAL